ncbi:hypothetical protein EON82_02510 [bacterium]|nr:MAG: hypothetical protein EON82_02510 [bacterium]
MKQQVVVEEPMLRQLDRWWFGYGSPTSIALFRIIIGTLGFLNLLMLSGDWEAWFGEHGFVPAWLGQAWLGPAQPIGVGDLAVPRLDLISGVTNPTLAIGFFVLATVSALTTALGLFTPISAFLFAVTTVSLHHRNIVILHGGDTTLRLGAIYLAVSPCGRACSLDRLFRLRRGEAEEAPQISLWPQRLVQFNMALIYFTTVWAKFFGPKWLNGTATWYPARLAEFYRFPVPSFMNNLPMVYLTTYGTLLVEFSLATLVFFRPLRNWVLLAGVLLHASIEYSMNIPLFSYLMTSYYVCHFEGEEIAAYAKRLGGRLRGMLGLEVYLPSGKKLTPNGERFLHAVDPFGLVRYLPNEHERQVNEGWDAKKPDGRRAHPFRGVAYRSPGAWLFLLVPGLWRRMMLRSVE